MQTQAFDNQYSFTAMHTVARYAGIGVLDVATAVGLHLTENRRGQLLYRLSSDIPERLRHEDALKTIVKFSGIDFDTVSRRLEYPEWRMIHNEPRYTDKAA